MTDAALGRGDIKVTQDTWTLSPGGTQMEVETDQKTNTYVYDAGRTK